MPEINTYEDQEQLIRQTAKKIVDLAHASATDKKRFNIALSGGSTPKALFEFLAEEPFIQWDDVHIWWSDERCVPPDHEDSNYRMANEALLQNIVIPQENIHRMQGELNPTNAATTYAKTLNDLFPTSPPVFDLILLGMGDDGHTASLFPGMPAIYEHNKLVVGHYVGKLKAWRITLTPVVINAAANVMFLVTGKNKAEPLRQVFRGVFQPHIYPSQIIQPRKGSLTWMLDKDAASLLDL
jgi:6-phosphogluconolactonase